MKVFGEEVFVCPCHNRPGVLLIIVSFVPSLQAQTKEIHSMWTCEIRRLLQLQFTMVKGELVLILIGVGPLVCVHVGPLVLIDRSLPMGL